MVRDIPAFFRLWYYSYILLKSIRGNITRIVEWQIVKNTQCFYLENIQFP